MEQNLDTMIDESVLGSALESIWLNVLGAHPERAPIDHLLVPEESYFAGVSITGVWNGACVFSCSEALARRITALMFGSDPDDVTADDLRDALGEMANLLGGQVKALVPEGSDISLPVVGSAPGAGISFMASKEMAGFDGLFCDEPFRFQVSFLDPSALPSRRRGDQVGPTS
ncbi:MAG: chemotaxis protein CheX [Planctomycetes bacterium]|nr:chemotaxis protein CheX [Planctomycetota bacterium]